MAVALAKKAWDASPAPFVVRFNILLFVLNAKYPNGIEAQKEKLEAEGHTIIQKGRKNIRYYVKDYENSLFDLK